MREHLNALKVRGYSEHTVKNRLVHIGFFIQWAYEHGLREPIEITRPVLERYQRHLFFYRKKNGEPLTFRSQHSRLVPLRVWFKWMTRQNHILHNPASEIDLPRLGRTLPKNILSVQEIEQVMMQPNLADPLGLRDRAILEVIYATGLRRLEMVNLKLFDLQLDRGLIVVRQGKGKKDRYVPIGERATAWLQKYIARSAATACHRTGRPHGVPDRRGRTVQPRSSDVDGARSHRGREDRQGRSLPSLCGTAWRRTCTRTEPTSATSSRSSATRTSRPRRFTRTSRSARCSRFTRRLIPRRSSRKTTRRRRSSLTNADDHGTAHGA